MTTVVDARGKACPQPVILTKQALAAGDPAGEVLVVVDNATAKGNVQRFAESQGRRVEVEERAGEYQVRVFGSAETTSAQLSGELSAPAASVAVVAEAARPGLVVQFGGDQLGRGEEQLGEALMKTFIYTLAQLEERPRAMVFLNRGVFLTTEGSPVLAHLLELAEVGTEVVSCGTCLDFYGRKELLRVGQVGNMYSIVEILAAAGRLISV